MPSEPTVTEMFIHLAQEGHFKPAAAVEKFEMPTTLRSVPTFVTYGTPDLPVSAGVGNAGLERNTQRNRG